MAKVEVKTKGFSSLSKSVNKLAQDTLKSTKLRKEIGESIKKKMVGLAKQGKDPVTKKNFKPLKQSTIRNRKRLKKYNKTSNVYSPSRSNLSFTGQLLDSIKVFLESGKPTIEIKTSGERKPYITSKKGNKAQDTPNNEELGTIHQFGTEKIPARPFIGINEDMKNAARKRIVRFLRRKLADILRGN